VNIESWVVFFMDARRAEFVLSTSALGDVQDAAVALFAGAK
jgi:hypothetical protein